MGILMVLVTPWETDGGRGGPVSGSRLGIFLGMLPRLAAMGLGLAARTGMAAH